jgi:hypothetical protein
MTFHETLITHDHRPDEALKDWLGNWSYLSIALKENKFSESELLSLIKFELMGKCRCQILDRLKARYNKLRARREQQELEKVRKRYESGKD